MPDTTQSGTTNRAAYDEQIARGETPCANGGCGGPAVSQTAHLPTSELTDLQIAQEQCGEWQAACRNLERINAEQLAEIERLRARVLTFDRLKTLNAIRHKNYCPRSICKYEADCRCWRQFRDTLASSAPGEPR